MENMEQHGAPCWSLSKVRLTIVSSPPTIREVFDVTPHLQRVTGFSVAVPGSGEDSGPGDDSGSGEDSGSVEDSGMDLIAYNLVTFSSFLAS